VIVDDVKRDIWTRATNDESQTKRPSGGEKSGKTGQKRKVCRSWVGKEAARTRFAERQEYAGAMEVRGY